MNSNLLLLKYNNYFDRKLKIENSLNDYLSYDYYIDWARNTKGDIAVVNFNPNDGINTQQIIQLNENLEEPNYCLVIQEGTIKSRWFITEMARTKIGQYQMTLRRDVLADYWNKGITDSPIYFSKGMVEDGNPLCFNPEPISMNQIKKKQTLLKDGSTAWLVAYIGKYSFTDNPVTIQAETGKKIVDYTYIDWNNYPYNANKDKLNYVKSNENSFTFTGLTSSGTIVKLVWNEYGVIENFNNRITQNQIDTILNYCETNNLYSTTDTNTNCKQVTDNEYRTLLNQRGSILSVGGSIYEMDTAYISQTISTSSVNTIIKNAFSAAGITTAFENCVGTITGIKLTAKSVTASAQENELPLKDSQKKCEDVPYKVMAIPYDDCPGASSDFNDGKVYGEVGRAIMGSLAEYSVGSTSFVYDIQILPYCPVEGVYNSDGELQHIGTENVDYEYITATVGGHIKNLSIAYFAPVSNRSFVINETIENPNLKYGKKEWNELYKYRINSPNWNGTFEFSAAMNDGVSGFEVNCSFKPLNPYIHVAPIFKSLYGGNYQDARGLICSGDYSMPCSTSQWQSYEINNKNYQNQFNLEIQTMDEQRDINRIRQKFSIGASALSSGVGMGIKTGNAASGIVASGLSTVGGIIDYQLTEKEYDLQKNMKSKSFEMSLGNIKARPNVLTKVGVLNPNNTIYPSLEEYSCTDTERELYEQNIKYRGMTLSAIGKIEDYSKYDDSWISGELIHSVGEMGNSDSHLVNVINEELLKGVYV